MLVRLPVSGCIIAYKDTKNTKDTAVALWSCVDSPIGTVWLAATERGLYRIAFASEAPPAPTSGSNDILHKACAWLDSYFAGIFLPVDFPLALDDDSFRQRCQWALADIPVGSTQTYSWLAATAGSPKAIRAAGSACATNPLPLVLPCHRIVRSDGTLGRYRGGHGAKRWLLQHERSLTA